MEDHMEDHMEDRTHHTAAKVESPTLHHHIHMVVLIHLDLAMEAALVEADMVEA